jgi:hypothetical protein
MKFHTLSKILLARVSELSHPSGRMPWGTPKQRTQSRRLPRTHSWSYSRASHCTRAWRVCTHSNNLNELCHKEQLARMERTFPLKQNLEKSYYVKASRAHIWSLIIVSTQSTWERSRTQIRRQRPPADVHTKTNIMQHPLPSIKSRAVELRYKTFSCF